MERMLNADFSRYAEMCGLPQRVVVRQALRNALPSVVTIVSVLYGFLIGGAVLVEIVFSWGGAGQYAVQGVLNADLNPVLGFVLFSAIFSLFIYLIVDLIYFAIDPRIRQWMRTGSAVSRPRAWRRTPGSAPLAAIEDLASTIRRYGASLRGAARHRSDDPARRDPRPGRRIGRRQDHARAGDHAARRRRPAASAAGGSHFDGPDLAASDEELRALRGRHIAMVVPNPRGELNPLLTVGQQIANVAMAHLGVDRRAAQALRARHAAGRAASPTRSGG